MSASHDSGSQTVGNPVFPAEVMDMIIDYLHTRLYSLKRCSLVCRDWKASARYHLFYTMSASPERVAFSDLLAFLTSAPDVCAYVKIFTLSGYRGISLKDLRAVVQPLTGIRSLTLDQMYISKPHWREPMLDPVVGTLSTLRVSSCNVVENNAAVLLNLLGLFSGITTLHLSHSMSIYAVRAIEFVIGTQILPRPSDQFPVQVPVENLTLRALQISVLDLLFSREYLPQRWASLRTLCLDGGCPTWKHVRKIGELLSFVGPQLHEISVRATYQLVAPHDQLPLGNGLPVAGPATTSDTTDEWHELRLDKCTRLGTFKISLGPEDRFARHDSKAVFKTTVDLLRHLPPTVTTLRIGFSSDRFNLHGDQFAQYRDFLMGLDWQALDGTLCAREAKKLKVVLDMGPVKEAFDRKHCQELFESVRGALPGLHSGDMLGLDVAEKKWWMHNYWE